MTNDPGAPAVPPLPLPEILLIVRDTWRRLGFAVRGDGGVLWWVVDELPPPDFDDAEIAAIETKVKAQIAHRQRRWRERAAAKQQRDAAGTGRPISRIFP